MIDESKSRQIAYEYISRLENVRILDVRQKIQLQFRSDLEIWEIATEVLFNNSIFPIVFHVLFTGHFPLEIPKIFLSPETFERTKYIPHVDNDRLVCTFDSEIVSTNPDEPAGILVQCLNRAKRIVLAGLNGDNDLDFIDEFKAYWGAKYGSEKYLPRNVLSLVSANISESSLRLICLNESLRNYRYVLHSSDTASLRFKEYLSEKDLRYVEVGVFYLGEIERTTPPFNLKNRDVIKIVKEAGSETLSKFMTFMNLKENPKLVLCIKYFGDRSYLFGWFHKNINPSVNGFRPGALRNFDIISTIQSNENVDRVGTDTFTRERLEKRTAGMLSNDQDRTYLVAGLGSIGSNLVYFLNSLNSPSFRLIDSDYLKLENINRHLLGFEYLGRHKTKAIKDYLLNNNPIQEVTTREISIVDVVNKDVAYVNEADYIFIAIGKANIDNWLCEALETGIIKKPIFIIWVEPFLIGGHCVYLHPSNPRFDKYFDKDYFRFNVIDRLEYEFGNSKLSLREAGCQTTYIPYSGANVVNFIAALFPYVVSIVTSGCNRSIAYTWLGNKEEVQNMGIKLSEYYRDIGIGSLLEHEV